MPGPERGKNGAPVSMDQPDHFLRALRRLFRYIFVWKGTLFALMGVTAVSIAIDIAIPLLIGACVDAVYLSAYTPMAAETFLLPLFALMILYALSAALGCVHGILAAKLSLRTEAQLREDLFGKMLKMPLSDQERWKNGDLMSRATNDTRLAATAFSDALLALFSSVIVIVGSATVMISRCAELAGVSILSSAVSVILTGAFSGLLLPAFARQQASMGFLTAHVEESIRTFRTCLAGNRTEENNRLMDRRNVEYYRSSLHAAKLEGLMRPLMLFFGNLNFLLIVLSGAGLVLSGRISFGVVQSFILYSRQLMEPASELGECFAGVQAAMAGAERVFELLDAPEEAEIEKETASSGQDASGSKTVAVPSAKSHSAHENICIRFENVTFGYRKSRPVLRNLSLDIPKGGRVAIVGTSGEGKTTMVSLLPLLYDHYEGAVLLDGTEIRQIRRSVLRRRIAVVTQEPQIIDGTIMENLLYGVENASEEQIAAAVAAVGLDRVLSKMPEGGRTPLLHGGESFSQGQLQLICLSRAILRDPEVLILDEATSSLDPLTEAELRRGMEAAMKGRTCIVIAHRISSVTDAECICVLHEGRIAERGSHAALLQKNGLYAELFRQQFIGRGT